MGWAVGAEEPVKNRSCGCGVGKDMREARAGERGANETGEEDLRMSYLELVQSAGRG